MKLREKFITAGMVKPMDSRQTPKTNTTNPILYYYRITTSSITNLILKRAVQRNVQTSPTFLLFVSTLRSF